ncbi:hypothetical protein M3J09_006930 [Ascochyta lentis]
MMALVVLEKTATKPTSSLAKTSLPRPRAYAGFACQL